MRILSVHVSEHEGDAAWVRISAIMNILRSHGHTVDEMHYVVPFVERSLYKRMQEGQVRDEKVVASSLLKVHHEHLKVLKKGHYDLVYGNQLEPAFFSLPGKFRGVPLIFDMHGSRVDEFALNNQSNPLWMFSPKVAEYLFDKVAEYACIRCSSKLFCVSRKMVNYLHQKKGLPLEKIAYVTNGIDLDFFTPASGLSAESVREQLDLEDKFIVGYIGGFQQWQGADALVRMAQGLREKDTHVLIVGADSEKHDQNIHYIPRVTRDRVKDFYSVCDILLLPRPHHPATDFAAPTKFAEYVAMGKPVLTTNVGDAAELVREHRCGTVVENNSVEELMKGVVELKEISGEEIRRMGRNSRHLAEHEFDWNKIGEIIEKELEAALNTKSHG